MSRGVQQKGSRQRKTEVRSDATKQGLELYRPARPDVASFHLRRFLAMRFTRGVVGRHSTPCQEWGASRPCATFISARVSIN